MRNLTLLTQCSQSFQSISSAGAESTLAEPQLYTPAPATIPPLCKDSASGTVYHVLAACADASQWVLACTTRPGDHCDRLGIHVLEALPVPPTGAVVVGLRYLLDQDAVFIALESGDVWVVRNVSNATSASPTATSQDDALLLDPVGCVDNGILAAEWSPDEELLVLITGNDNLILMTKDFDVLYEFRIHAATQGEEVSVSVGWGRKETQFHGTAGKQAAQQKTSPRDRRLADTDDGRPRVSWRGDGALFVCSLVETESDNSAYRALRIYNREAVLLHTSEPIGCLEHALCWKPSGAIIATSEKLPHRRDIIFWERNGLRHNEFTLREPHGAIVKALAWNCDSTVLAVTLEHAGHTIVQLWTDRNYHWYLKQQLEVTADDTITLLGVVWDPEEPLVLDVVTTESHQCLRFAWDHLFGYSHAPNALSTAAVIDGQALKLTPFRLANVPPPMCHTTLDLPYPAKHVAFVHSADTIDQPHANDILVLGTGNPETIAMYRLQPLDQPRTVQPRLLGTIEVPRSSLVLRQVCMPQPHIILALGRDLVTHRDVIAMAQLTWRQGDNSSDSDELLAQSSAWTLGLWHEWTPPTPNTTSFHRLVVALDSSQAYVQDNQGRISQIQYATLGTFGTTPLSVLHSPAQTPYTWLTIANDRAPTAPSRQPTVVGQQGSSLFVDGQRISSGCTSYFVHDHYLLFTTVNHQLRMIPRLADVATMEQLATENPTGDTANVASVLHTRRVERGSRLVLAVNQGTTVVLQMPRGNLETIEPRPLVLAAIRTDLDRRDYRRAFLACRKHRIDMNLLHDHVPARFMADLDEFVRQVNDPDYLNLFLSSLQTDNVVKSKYPPPILLTSNAAEYSKSNSQSASGMQETWLSEQCQPDQYPDKRVTVCARIQEILEATNDPRYLQSIITASVCKDPTSLQEAIQVLCGLRRRDQSASDSVGNITNETSMLEDTLQYLLFLADVEKVYNAALAAYDLPLALLVAQHSQMDPKEYLAFLTELQGYDQYYRQFRIHDYLRQYPQALTNLARAGPHRFDEVKAYIERHAFYTQGLALYRDGIRNDGENDDNDCSGLDSSNHQARYREISALYARYLSAEPRRQHAKAAALYLQAGDLVQAMKSFQRAGQWQTALSLAAMQGVSKQAQYAMARDTAERLADRQRYAEAAQVYLDYTPEKETAVQMLVKGSDWFEAIRIAHLYERPDLIETTVQPGLDSAIDALRDELEMLTNQWETTLKRVTDIRAKAQAEASARAQTEARLQAAAMGQQGPFDGELGDEAAGKGHMIGGGGRAPEPQVDVMSEASTHITRMTQYTGANTHFTSGSLRSGKTAKSRRKQERNKLRGKKGSAFEEQYLVESVGRLVDRLIKITLADAQKLYQALMAASAQHQLPLSGAATTASTSSTAASLSASARRAAATAQELYLKTVEPLLQSLRSEMDFVYDPVHIQRLTAAAAAAADGLDAADRAPTHGGSSTTESIVSEYTRATAAAPTKPASPAATPVTLIKPVIPGPEWIFE
ncbi:putative elongator complex protein 1 [Dimargaris xerosporica]|nr:putative elongator complex protein 1 [Dimargaris xerosporica]